jgi:ADP-dependent NAD(P)H-hydrate dehydratase / NAD(P)H-hydrate epimerase
MATVTISREILDKIYVKRPENSRKYDFGYLLIVGGSDFYSGAPAMSALAAFNAGVDMVRIVAPRRASDIIATFSPMLATTPLEGSRLTPENVCVLLEAVESINLFSEGKCAVVIGGGIGRSKDTMEAVREFVGKLDGNIPAVIDADAIRPLAENIEALKGKKLIFTPHAREFCSLTGNKCDGLSDEQLAELVQNQAASLGISIILKGKTDFISNGTDVAWNNTGNALMTKGGTGDTLAGIVGALLARGVDMFDAACAAAYINGAAGDLAGSRRGEAVTAMDLIDEIPNVLPKYEY